jgi:hypothetical protein
VSASLIIHSYPIINWSRYQSARGVAGSANPAGGCVQPRAAISPPYAFVVGASDETAERFYEAYQFLPLASGRRLSILTTEIAELFA